jgi:hypothetical protein
VAKSERVSLNQFFNVCVAEKLSARRAEESFQERFLRAAPAGILHILQQAKQLNPLWEAADYKGADFTGCGKTQNSVILSEAKNLSSI